jgi:hypothetical protein
MRVLLASLSVVAIAGTTLVSAPLAHAQSAPVDGSGTAYYLNNSWGGAADIEFEHGGPQDQVYFGDWNGDGVDTPMLRRGNVFSISDSNDPVRTSRVVTYGDTSDVVLAGDWNGDGVDTLAVRRGAHYFLKDSLATGVADTVVHYGNYDDVVLAGDWDGDGVDTLSVRRGAFYLVNNAQQSGVATVVYQYGEARDHVLVGDWDGDGLDTLAVQRGTEFHIRNSTTSGPADLIVLYGDAGDVAFAGDWNGDDADTLGVRREAVVSPATLLPMDDANLRTQDDLLARINYDRVVAGLSPVTPEPCLDGVAQSWSETMAQNRLGGTAHNPSLADDMRACGMRGYGENVGQRSDLNSVEMHAAWMRSEPHRANILRPSFTHIGIGIARTDEGRVSYVLDFGTR